jgi:hypothetical protein
MALSNGVKRVLRSLWVLVANGIQIRMTFASIFGEPLNPATMNREHWLEFLLKAAVPAVGIALDLVGSRFAKWVNVGYFTLLGLFYCAETVRWWSDPFHGVLLISGLGLLIVAGLTELIYRVTKNSRPSNEPPGWKPGPVPE